MRPLRELSSPDSTDSKLRHRRGQIPSARRLDGDTRSVAPAAAAAPGIARPGVRHRDVDEARLRQGTAGQQVGLARGHLGPELVGGLHGDELQPPLDGLPDDTGRAASALPPRVTPRSDAVVGRLEVGLLDPALELDPDPLARAADHPGGDAGLQRRRSGAASGARASAGLPAHLDAFSRSGRCRGDRALQPCRPAVCVGLRCGLLALRLRGRLGLALPGGRPPRAAPSPSRRTWNHLPCFPTCSSRAPSRTRPSTAPFGCLPEVLALVRGHHQVVSVPLGRGRGRREDPPLDRDLAPLAPAAPVSTARRQAG